MLRPLLTAVLAGTLGLPAVAADPVVWLTDYAAARKEAEEKNLPLLVVVGTEQCLYCRKLEAVTFADKNVLAALTGKVVLLKVDANKDAEFARAMRVSIYPTTIMAGADGKVFAYLSGYVAPEQFQEHTGKAFDLIATANKEKAKPADATATLTARVTKPETPADLLAQAKEAYKAERYADCQEQAEAVSVAGPNTPAAVEAVALAAAVKADPDKLSRAGEQLDDKFAAAYFTVAEGLESKGRMKEASGYFEKVVAVAPAGKLAERARSRLADIARTDTVGKVMR